MTRLVGGVSQLYQGDLDVGRRLVEQLATLDLGADVLVEELHYGAVAVVQRLEELRPDALVIVGAAEHGRAPGTVERRRIEALELPTAEVQLAVSDAVTGYVSIELLLQVAAGLGALPPRTVVIEVEPALTGPGEDLSPEIAAALPDMIDMVRAEVRRAPLLSLVDELRDLLSEPRLEPSPALTAMDCLLAELHELDRHGAWGGAFRERDRVRAAIGAGLTGEGMTHVDWALWWTLIEELDRIAVEEI